jgi:hypothetical protein
MFKDNNLPWIVYHDGEVQASKSMKCHHVTRGEKVVVKELKGI